MGKRKHLLQILIKMNTCSGKQTHFSHSREGKKKKKVVTNSNHISLMEN